MRTGQGVLKTKQDRPFRGLEDTLCDGAEPIRRAAESTRLKVVAEASVERPHVMRTDRPLPPRCEHLLALVRSS